MDIEKIIKQLSIEQKASLLVGHENMSTKPIEELDIPPLIMSDGPNGVRKELKASGIENNIRTAKATCFPCGSLLSCSFDNDLFYKVGKQIALECRYYDVNALLGPAINIKRNPLCGRNFEYLSEDPLLAGYLSSNFIKGVQEEDVIACIKHYACNNLEKWRYIGDSIVDLQALNDIYLKPFEIAIRESNPMMVMTSYNQINGRFASENEYLLKDRLRETFGFKGLTVTDWGGMVHRDTSLNNGQDLEMPGSVPENVSLIIEGVKSGLIKKETLDSAVRNLLNVINKTRIADKDVDESIFNKSNDIAIEAVTRSAVLLKNDYHILPLDKSKKYVIIGGLFEEMRYQGGGSALINPYMVIDNKTAFDKHHIQYSYSRGYDQYTNDINSKLEQETIELCKDAEEIIFFGGLTDLSESEGFDRPDMRLPDNQIRLIDELVKLKKKIIFIMYGGAPFEIPHHEDISAMLYMNLPGQSGGEALVKLLFGEISPSGRLAFSWPYRYEDVPYSDEFCSSPIELYKESIFVGYRYYSSVNKEVLFPFGYGLTYGEYHYEDMSINRSKDDININVTIVNDKDIPIDVVPQMYVSCPNSHALRVEKELKSYAKIHLDGLERKKISLKVKLIDLAIYDVNRRRSVIEKGKYIISLSDNVLTDVFKEEIDIAGEELSFNENYQVYLDKNKINSLSKEEFEKVIGQEVVEYIPNKRSYTLETPIMEFNSFFGKIIKKEMLKVGDKVIKQGKKIKDEKESRRVIKSGVFMKKAVLVNCLRSLCYSSSGILPYQKALGILDLANSKVFKGLGKLLKK